MLLYIQKNEKHILCCTHFSTHANGKDNEKNCNVNAEKKLSGAAYRRGREAISSWSGGH